MTSVVRIILVVLVSAVAAIALMVGVDQYAHRKFDGSGTLNYRGYRGAIVGKKEPGERRIGVFGGSSAMGYGLPSDQSIAARLGALLNRDGGRRTTVLNLAATGDDTLVSFASNYQQFAYLQLDALAFLVFNDDIVCRADTPSVPEWSPFVAALVERQAVLAHYVLAAAGVSDERSAANASDAQRQKLMAALNSALRSPDVIDGLDVAAARRGYMNEADTSFRLKDHLTCLVNLEVLQRTLGPAFHGVDGVEQLSPSGRTRNPVFRRFNYWFVATDLAWEKYFLLRYGDIAEGYQSDPWLRWAASARTRVPLAGPSAGRHDHVRVYTSTTFIRDLTAQGKQVYLLMYPMKDESWRRTVQTFYFDSRFKNDSVRVVDLLPVFREGGWDRYFLEDHVHFSRLGNEAIANALAESMDRQVRVP